MDCFCIGWVVVQTSRIIGLVKFFYCNKMSALFRNQPQAKVIRHSTAFNGHFHAFAFLSIFRCGTLTVASCFALPLLFVCCWKFQAWACEEFHGIVICWLPRNAQIPVLFAFLFLWCVVVDFFFLRLARAALLW